jgi:putative transposase
VIPGETIKGRQHTPEQIVRKLREGERLIAEGKSLGEVAKALEVSDYTYRAGATSTAA